MTESVNEKLIEIVRRLVRAQVVVWGDVMLDEFVWGDVTRISPEAPVPVVDVRRESVRPGGAANVVANTVALGARATLVGVIGADAAGERLRAELVGVSGAVADFILDESRPTTVKTRIIAHNQLVVRTDRESRAPVDEATEDRLTEALLRALDRADALVVSDYDKGAVTGRVLARVLPQAKARKVPVLVDPKIRNFAHYQSATLITPNHHEALRLAGTEDDTDAGIAHAAQAIREKIGCPSVLVTRGERGMMLLEKTHAPVYISTAAQEVYDVTGAGDTVIATLAAALGAGASLVEAARLANHAAGIVVGKLGTATASADELVERLRSCADETEPVKL
jgi:D-beta-D-heptose 7-phosphate kinase/D-beta-D-heptose 1-phosphate adenosyltransferase